MALISRVLTPDTFLENALPVLEEIIFSTLEQYPDIIPKLANVKGATGSITQTTEQSGVGKVVLIPEGTSITYDDVAQGAHKTFTFAKYGIGVKITEEMIDDQKFDQVGDIYESMARSMFDSRQQAFMDNFNNAFTTTGYDGVTLCSTTHPLIKAGGTENNRPTADVDLSVTSLRTALTDIKGTLSHEGLKQHLMPRYLLVSDTNIYDAHELLKSDLRPGGFSNDTNYFTILGMEYLSSTYLTDSDAWFVVCDKHKVMWYDRKAPTVKSQEDFDAGCLKTKINARWDTGHASWFGIWGSSGA
jgi:hypothetical protein